MIHQRVMLPSKRDLNRLQKSVNRNRAQHLERNYMCMHQYTRRTSCLESSFSKNNVEVLVDAS